MVDGQQVVAGLLDAARDAVAVLRAHGIERFEDHQGQRALPDFGLGAHIGFPNEYGRLLWESNRGVRASGGALTRKLEP